MHFYIRREPNDQGLGSQTPDVPRKLLAKHGARMLNAEAGPSSTTAYRTDVLRVPHSVDRTVLEQTLADVNLKLAEPQADANRPPVVRLEKRDPNQPADIDAWRALSHLRAKAADEPDGQLAAAVNKPDPVGLERLLFIGLDPAPWDSHALGPAPWDSHSVGPVPWDSHSVFGANGYLRSARGGPVPVSLSTNPPNRRALADRFDRRPVIAVLDTGISAHEWFGTTDREVPPGGYLRVLKEVQDAITASSRAAGTGARVIEDYWEEIVPDNPLTGEFNPHTGHGTFIAGILRQVAPDAEVAVARVMAGDGVAYESDLTAALERLVQQVEAAQAPGGNPADMIDVLSLSIGYYIENAQDEAETTEFTTLINRLADLGVLVVAAAGNDATTRPFYPAALATVPPSEGGQPVLSVGALNPNGTKAFFSNQAPWVHAWASGASVVSTFPKLSGGVGPTYAMRALDRESMDPDDFTSGFAMWHGTSFAGPHTAAALANKLIELADTDPELRMGLVSQDAMRKRARRAVEACTTP